MCQLSQPDRSCPSPSLLLELQQARHQRRGEALFPHADPPTAGREHPQVEVDIRAHEGHVVGDWNRLVHGRRRQGGHFLLVVAERVPRLLLARNGVRHLHPCRAGHVLAASSHW